MRRVIEAALAASLLTACGAGRPGAGGSTWIEAPAAPPATEAAPEIAQAPRAQPAPTTAPEAPPAPPFEGTTGVSEVKREGMKPATLARVRAAGHEGFDRVVFELAPSSGVPGYRVEYFDEPVRRCGSGEPAAVAGEAWLAVQLRPAQAHDDKGKATVKDRERRLRLPSVREAELTCDFEGDVTWVIGVPAKKRYRVLELADPPRLVVDILH